MPVEFLTAAQEARYGCYTGDPTPEHLARCFYFDDLDQALILARRTSVTRLGFAVQLGTIRFLGTFLTNPGAVPLVVITTITAQLGLPADTDLALYQSPDTWWDHQALIRQHYGYQDMLTLPVLIPLLRWLYSRA